MIDKIKDFVFGKMERDPERLDHLIKKQGRLLNDLGENLDTMNNQDLQVLKVQVIIDISERIVGNFRELAETYEELEERNRVEVDHFTTIIDRLKKSVSLYPGALDMSANDLRKLVEKDMEGAD